MRPIHIIATVAALAFAVSPALAEKGGRGNGSDSAAPVVQERGGGKGNGGGHNATPAPASCSVAGNVVTGTGLPTDEVINFMITDASGTWGWVLGYSEGTSVVTVPAPDGATTYEFVSRTWGPNGTRYAVFASCS